MRRNLSIVIIYLVFSAWCFAEGEHPFIGGHYDIVLIHGNSLKIVAEDVELESSVLTTEPSGLMRSTNDSRKVEIVIESLNSKRFLVKLLGSPEQIKNILHTQGKGQLSLSARAKKD